MQVNPRDGRCRECGGTLNIVDVDDATMLVPGRLERGASYATTWPSQAKS